MKIGSIGLGSMGSAMSQNLLRAGHELTVFNRTREKTESLARQGARVANSPAQLARDSEAVVTMLPDDAALDEVTLGESGILTGVGEGAAHISSSTISINAARRLTEEHHRRARLVESRRQHQRRHQP